MVSGWKRLWVARKGFVRWLSCRAGAVTRKPLAVFTMVYNEQRMLPVWVRYYRQQVGAENLFILDHGSESLPDLPDCHVIPLRRHELDEIDRCAQVQAFQKRLLRTIALFFLRIVTNFWWQTLRAICLCRIMQPMHQQPVSVALGWM